MPVPEDPTRPLPNPDKTDNGKPITRLTPDGQLGDPVRTKNVHRLAALGQQVDVFLPDGWSVKTEDDRILLVREKLAGTIVLGISSGGRPQVASVLRTANDSSFPRFRLVSLREDPVPGLKKSGAFVASTLRIGPTTDGGELVAWHAAGSSGTIVWRIDYTNASQDAFKSDRRQIERLIEYLAAEIVR
jgi:hypothetical protein